MTTIITATKETIAYIQCSVLFFFFFLKNTLMSIQRPRERRTQVKNLTSQYCLWHQFNVILTVSETVALWYRNFTS